MVKTNFITAAFMVIMTVILPSKLSAYDISGSTVTLKASDRTADNTALIQGFLDNKKYTKIIIEPGANNSSWLVKPLWFKHDNTEIHLNANTVVEAMPGEYTHRMACVLKAVKLKNVKVTGGPGSRISMHKKEYAKLPKGEYRHALKFIDCTNVSVFGLTITNTGGDGIYIGESVGCSNVNINDVIVDGASRNGLAAVSVNGLTVKNCVFKNTKGLGNAAAHGPWAGLDLEPYRPDNVIKNVLIENCLFLNNGRRGFLIHSPHFRTGKDPLVNVMVRNCVVKGNECYGVQVSIIPSRLDDNSSIVFENCTISDNNYYGVMVYNKGKGAGTLSFNNCYLANNNLTTGDTPFTIYNTSGAREDGGNVKLNNVAIVQTTKRPVKYSLKIDSPYFSIDNISGNIYASGGTLFKSGKTSDINVKQYPLGKKKNMLMSKMNEKLLASKIELGASRKL